MGPDSQPWGYQLMVWGGRSANRALFPGGSGFVGALRGETVLAPALMPSAF